MKLILTDTELIKLVYTSFVDGGLTMLRQCNVELKYLDKHYSAAKKAIDKPSNGGVESICFEDVLVELFKRNELYFYDHNDEQKLQFNLEITRNNFNDLLTGELINERAVQEVLDILIEDGSYDAYTCLNVLQFILYKELVYS